MNGKYKNVHFYLVFLNFLADLEPHQLAHHPQCTVHIIIIILLKTEMGCIVHYPDTHTTRSTHK